MRRMVLLEFLTRLLFRPSSESPGLKSSPGLRRLGIGILVFFALLELGIGILGSFFLRKTDRLYTEVIETSVPLLNHLRIAAVEISNIQRFSGNLLLARSASETEVFKGRIDQTWRDVEIHLTEIDVLSKRQGLESFVTTMLVTRDCYRQASETFLKLATFPTESEALAFRADVLRPAFEALNSAQNELADYVATAAAEVSEKLSARAATRQRLLLALTAGPYFLGVAFIGASVMFWLLFVRKFDDAVRS
jgi:hypothetical protein